MARMMVDMLVGCFGLRGKAAGVDLLGMPVALAFGPLSGAADEPLVQTLVVIALSFPSSHPSKSGVCFLR